MIRTLVVVAALLSAGPKKDAEPADPALLAEYNAQRAKAGGSADAHWKLGLWCEQKGLKPEAQVEFFNVTQLDPGRDAAWKKLGLVKHGGQWKTRAQIEADRAETEAQRKADNHWRPLLQKWKTSLARKDRRAETEEELARVKDPRAVPMVWKVFANGTPSDQERAIDILGHIDGERSTRAMAGMAVYGKTETVRQAALATLARRNPDDVVMNWIMLLREPTKYEVRPVAGPGSPGVLFVEGEQFNFRRFYAPPSVSQTQSMFVDSNLLPTSFYVGLQFNSSPPGPPPGSRPIGFDQQRGTLYVYDYHWAPPPPPPKPPDPSLGYQAAEQAAIQAETNLAYEFGEATKMAIGAQAQLEHDINVVESANTATRELNARLAEALRRISGKDLGADREAWLKWWMTKRGYTYTPPKERPKTTIDMMVPLPYVPQTGPPIIGQADGGGGGNKWCLIYDKEKNRPWRFTPNSCFGAGTAVLTPNGPCAIESLQAGQPVLTQGGTGTVAAVHRSRAARTLRLTFQDDAVLTTEGHPFWKGGSGWVRAGDLAPGDEVFSRNGRVRVDARAVCEGTEVWNLRVDNGASFYVGRGGVLVHDVSPIPGAEIGPLAEVDDR